MVEEKQTAHNAPSERQLKINARRRGHQRRQALRREFVANLADFLKCSPSDVPSIARIRGIPL